MGDEPYPSLPQQDVLPFPPRASGSIAGRTMQESIYSPRPEHSHLPAGSPNILIILVDDAGPGLPSNLGGEVATPNLERVMKGGVGYNRFHTTAMCSPTRGALLTGRNHHHIASGQIAELANDWDGYAGAIPMSCATVAEVLKNYGYATSAFGKWHNTPALETTAAGPFHNWPTGLGFEYFYGFLAGEASQYEPHLVRNTTVVPPPRTPEQGYHLSEDLADDAIGWLQRHKAFRPDKPFFMYWASGAIHGPHHVMKEWADRYKGRFDDGWDAYRERVFQRAKACGWIPAAAELTARPDTLQSWDSIPDEEKPFQRRLMEVAAGFAEHVDHQIGRLLDQVEALGYGDDTLVFYIWGDNGSSGEGQLGTVSELLAQNQIPSTVAQHIAALEAMGGLDLLGSPKCDNQYHAAWAWAGSTPYKGMKLLASHLGGTRNPMAVRWPARIAPDAAPRTQFHHVNDIAPTIYEVIGITPPRVVNGFQQDPLDGVSLAYSFNDPGAAGRLHTQYFEIMGSRAIYHDGWMASAFGPREPWTPGAPKGGRDWTPDDDVWELYDLDADWSQAHDLAPGRPEKVAQMKELFAIEAARNKVYPVGGGLWVPFLHPELRISPPYTTWDFGSGVQRMPEFAAPALGNRPNVVSLDLDIPPNASGVLYKLGGAAGGLTCWMDDGRIAYEYNLFIIQRTQIRSAGLLPTGRVKLEIETICIEPHPAGRLGIRITANGTVVAQGEVPVSAPLLFTANDCLDFGAALGAPVSLDYYDRAPFPFTGTIHHAGVRYVGQDSDAAAASAPSPAARQAEPAE